MTRLYSLIAGCCVALAACSSPVAESGPLAGTWVYHGADSANDYYDLLLTHTDDRIGGRYQLCRPTLCSLGPVSAQYADSSFTYEMGLFYHPQIGQTVPAVFIGRLATPDTLVGILSNFAVLQTDTLTFTRTDVQIPDPIVPGLPN